GHDVGDARALVPLDQEALHRPDRERTIDVAAAAGPLAWRRADVGEHRRHRVGLPRQDVALLEPALGREVQVAAAVGPDRARLLALDVALEPGRVDGLDEEFLEWVDGHDEGRASLALRSRCRVTGTEDSASAGAPNLPSRLSAPQRRTPERKRVPIVAAGRRGR